MCPPWLGCCVRLAGFVSCLVSNLSPIWLCLSPWLGCCVRLAGLVSQFVSHLALSFSLAGVLCPPRWVCLLSCFQFEFRFLMFSSSLCRIWTYESKICTGLQSRKLAEAIFSFFNVEASRKCFLQEFVVLSFTFALETIQ